MRIAAWIAGGMAGIVLVLVVLAFTIDANNLRGLAADAASGALGRTVTIGRLSVAPGWTTRVEIAGLRVANPGWAMRSNLAAAQSLDFDIRIWPLLTGRIDVPRAALAGGELNLERDAQGRKSWDLPDLAEELGGAVKPERRDEAPAFGQIEVTGTMVRLDDAKTDVTFEGTIETAAADGGGQAVEIALSGSLHRDNVEIDFIGGSLERLRRADAPYPIRLKANLGASTFRAEGVVQNPFSLTGIDAEMALAGPNLAALLPSLKLPLPATAAYEVAGRVVREGENWRATIASGRVGRSDLKGTLEIETGGEKPLIRGALVSERLEFEDLAPLIGLPPPGNRRSAQEQSRTTPDARSSLLPSARLDPARFHTANADLDIKANKVRAPNAIPLTAITTHVALSDGRLVLDPFDVEAAGGNISGRIVVDARGEVAAADTELSFRELDLRQFFRGTKFVQEMGGRFAGSVSLNGTGFSVADILAQADGAASIIFEEGSMSGLVVEAIGLDLAEALAMLVTGDARIALDCGRVDMQVRSGRAKIVQAVADTSDSVIFADGSVNLGEERLDVKIQASSKDFSLIDAAAPVAITGPFRDPVIGIGNIDPLPFLEIGDQQDLDCSAIIAGERLRQSIDEKR